MTSLYNQEVSKFGKKDAMIALGFFIYFMIRNIVRNIIYSQFNVSADAWMATLIVFNIVDVLIVFIIVKIRKQNLASIGLHKKNIWVAAGLGLLFAPIFILSRVLPGIIWELELSSLGSLLLALIGVTFWAVREDIAFVGFIQTRLHGIVKSDFWAINLGATFFTLAHVPTHLAHGIPTGGTVFILLLVNWFFMHRAFVMLFKRHFSLAPVFITHVASNFPSLWQSGGRTGWLWGAIPTVVFVVAVELWYWRWSESSTDERMRGLSN